MTELVLRMVQLTADLVERLRVTNLPEVRRDTAELVAARFAEPALSDDGRLLAESIFRILLSDSDASVRVALADGLKHCPDVSPDIAISLANDIADVAVPMLEASTVFSDAELIAIVRDQAEAWQCAVARRATVSEAVCDAIVDHGTETVVTSLVTNRGARLTERTSHKVIDRFATSDAVMGGLACRPSLPPELSERLISMASERLRQQLSERSDLPADISERLALYSREAATLQLISPKQRRYELERLVHHLQTRDRLTDSLLLRALCIGDLPFFEAATALRTGASIDNIRVLLSDRGKLGIESLCRAANLPETMADVIHTAVEVQRDIEDLNGANGRDAYQRIMTEQFRDRFPAIEPGNADALFGRLSAGLGD